MFFIPFGTKEKFTRILFPYVNISIVLLNLLVFVFEIYLLVIGGEALLAQFIDSNAAVPASIMQDPIQTGLFASMFLHAGLLHFVGNMIYLLPFGDNIEDRLGHLRYLFFYLACGVVATGAFVLLNPDTTTPLVGASGAIAGVLGGYLALHPLGTVKGFLFIIILLTRVDLPALVFIGYWFLLQLFSTVSSFGSSDQVGGVAYEAHLAGFVAGLLLMPLFTLGKRRAAESD